MPAPIELKYRAFLSYAHADASWGRWLLHRLWARAAPTAWEGAGRHQQSTSPSASSIWSDQWRRLHWSAAAMRRHERAQAAVAGEAPDSISRYPLSVW